jgi:hypothetical protein
MKSKPERRASSARADDATATATAKSSSARFM